MGMNVDTVQIATTYKYASVPIQRRHSSRSGSASRKCVATTSVTSSKNAVTPTATIGRYAPGSLVAHFRLSSAPATSNIATAVTIWLARWYVIDPSRRVELGVNARCSPDAPWARYVTSGQMEYAPSDTVVSAGAFPPASWMWKLLRMMSTGSEGLVASVSGIQMTKLAITVNETAQRFCCHENFRRNTMARKIPKTIIWGRVRTAAERASHAHAGRPFSASKIAARTKKMLMTCVCPQMEALNQTAGLNRNKAVAVACQRRLSLIAPMIR